MTRVLIVDDYAPFRARARALLEAEGFVCIETQAGLASAQMLMSLSVA